MYPNIAARLRDRTAFLKENSIYAKAGLYDPCTKGNFTKEAKALKKAGYATQDGYVELLENVWKGRTMKRPIDAAIKERCAVVLAVIEISLKDGAKVALAKA